MRPATAGVDDPLRLWLEDKLRPPLPADPRPRDLLCVALLLILASVLLPAWGMVRGGLLYTVAGQMASAMVLPALGFLLALRAGAVDLSVWVVSGLSGVLAAAMISRAVPVPVAFLGGAALGLAMGMLNGACVVVVRLPSPLVTFLTASAAIAIVGALVPGRSLAIPEWTFYGLLSWHNSPILALRVICVCVVYLSATMGLWMIDLAIWRGVHFPRRVGLFAALSSSGLLAGIGGMLWLVDTSRAPLPTRVIDDLRLPAAAILAGGLFLGRKGRELLAATCLPPAMLLATIWRQKAWDLPAPGQGLALQMLVLMGMAVGVHVAFGRYLDARGTGRRMPAAGVLLTLTGLCVAAAAAHFQGGAVQGVFHAAGTAAWLAGLPMVVASLRQEARLDAAEA